MKLSFLGHACLLLETANGTLLIDPFITGNKKASGKVAIDTLEPDYILLTHAHQDHTLDVEMIARRTAATIISNFEIATYYQKKGFTAHPMNHGGKWDFEFGRLKYVNALHSSSFADGTYGGQPGGFVIQAGGKTVYVAGDTALSLDMKLIAMRFKLDLAVLPIGDNFTMGISDAIIAADFLKCNRIMGYHYDTFGYIEIDRQEAKKSFKESGKQLLLPEIGASIAV